jgi:hypothetical protein
MKLKKTILASSIVVLTLAAADVSAKVSAAEAAKLGTDVLTPVGAETPGNAAGTIPKWTGGYQGIPKGFVPGGHYPNPFPDDKVLFTITKANMSQYKANLTAGQMALLTKYSDYKLPVYQSRRSVGFPKKIYEAARHNATSVELTSDGNGLTPYEIAVPFPIPKNAHEVIWNHIARYRGGAVERKVVQVTPLANGDFTPVLFSEQVVPRYALTDYNPKKDPNILFYFKQAIESPARLAGNVILVHETLDQVAEPRRAWVYNAGQRRVRRAPQVAYDGPGTASDGLRTSDNFDMYNGAQDKYNWKLVGKQELYIPYNSYKLMSPKYTYTDIVRPGHINMDLTRYELHRVWKVEATLKKGERHIYAKRVFYIDEDSWQISEVDHYDGRGELWRVGEGHQAFFYDVKTPVLIAHVLQDLLSGRFLANGLTNEQAHPYIFGKKFTYKDFTPAGLRRSGR